MKDLTRRASLLAGAALFGAPALPAAAAAQGAPARAPAAPRREGEISPSGRGWRHLRWAKTHEGQRKADLGNGTFLNPIMAGDHPDPSILKDGRDYYMTFSSFDGY